MAELTRAEAAAWLVGHAGLTRRRDDGVPALLGRRRCIQLDPLDRIGTNADLVAAARLDGVARGAVYHHLLPGHAFEHFAKERCLLPAAAFPWYRDRAAEHPWWRLTERLKRLDDALIIDVLAELTERGASTAAALTDRGRVRALDWSGWKGTGRATTMALEVLWTRCQVVVCGRAPGGTKIYDIPTRALPEVATAPVTEPFARWALRARVEAAGLLPSAGGPMWGLLRDVRTTLPATLVEEGLLETVRIAGSRRTWFAPADFRDRRHPAPDGEVRILGPLDPVLWDRKLVEHAFGFEYVWEVYKPAAKRRWGYYVCPLLQGHRLVGRLEAKVVDNRLTVEQIWDEGVDRDALRDALERHATFLGVDPPATLPA